MNKQHQEPSAVTAVCVGLLGLASAMGIGRFSLTPILPLMQHDQNLTLADGGWLASANYVGYLAGGLICMMIAPRPALAIRAGLIGCGIFTLAMGLSNSIWLWALWRLLAGIASALVLVGISAWAMPTLGKGNKERWSGQIFSGVGVGIAFAGFVGLIAGIEKVSSQATWLALGLTAVVLALFLWRPLSAETLPKASPPLGTQRPAFGRFPRRALVAAGCYTVFGYGYIIPATFLPAIARAHVDNPAIFGWVWPAFGVAAAVSTIVALRLGEHLSPRQMWLRAQWLLIAGVIAPVLTVNLITLTIAAVCVGGSFMVITMSGIKEILRIGGAAPSRLIGLMTSGFAVGQIAGPLTVALLASSGDALRLSSVIAASALIISNCMLAADDAMWRQVQGQPRHRGPSWTSENLQ